MNKQLAFRKWKDGILAKLRPFAEFCKPAIRLNSSGAELSSFFTQSIKIRSWTETWLAVHNRYIMESRRAFLTVCVWLRSSGNESLKNYISKIVKKSLIIWWYISISKEIFSWVFRAYFSPATKVRSTNLYLLNKNCHIS